jgi:hypothetical protein
MTDLHPDDAKLVVLARAARARVGAASGAALRDGTGRTYTGADVRLPSLRLSSVEVAVAQATASGSDVVEAIAVVAADASIDTAPAADLGCALVIRADPTGAVQSVQHGG